MGDLQSRTLNLSVWHAETMWRNVFLGEVEVSLGLWDWTYTQPVWHDLQPRVMLAWLTNIQQNLPATMFIKYLNIFVTEGFWREQNTGRSVLCVWDSWGQKKTCCEFQLRFYVTLIFCSFYTSACLSFSPPLRLCPLLCRHLLPLPPSVTLQVTLNPKSISSRGTIVLSIKFIPDGFEGDQGTHTSWMHVISHFDHTCPAKTPLPQIKINNLIISNLF